MWNFLQFISLSCILLCLLHCHHLEGFYLQCAQSSFFPLIQRFVFSNALLWCIYCSILDSHREERVHPSSPGLCITRWSMLKAPAAALRRLRLRRIFNYQLLSRLPVIVVVSVKLIDFSSRPSEISDHPRLPLSVYSTYLRVQRPLWTPALYTNVRRWIALGVE